MYRYIAIVRDHNISGELMIPVETITEAESIIRDAGRWCAYPDALSKYYNTGGAVLLSEPSVYLVRIPRDSTARIMAHRIVEEYAYGFTYDAMLETGPRGGVSRVL